MKKFIFTISILVSTVCSSICADVPFNTWAATNSGFYSMLTNRGFNAGTQFVGEVKIGNDDQLFIWNSATNYMSFGSKGSMPLGINTKSRIVALNKDVIFGFTVGEPHAATPETFAKRSGAGTWLFATNVIIQGSLTATNGVKIGASGSTITNIVTATQVVSEDVEVTPGATYDLDFTVAGSKLNDVVEVGLPSNFPAQLIVKQFVQSAGIVRVRCYNPTATNVSIGPSKTYRVKVTQF